MSIRTLFVASLLAGTALASVAQAVARHPAKPTESAGRANFEHPAVVVHRRAARPSIDPNTFIVQPPAQVEWRLPETLAVDAAAMNARF